MMTFDRSRRLLFGAFAVSAVLHLVLMFGWGEVRMQVEVAAPAVPLRAVVAMPAVESLPQADGAAVSPSPPARPARGMPRQSTAPASRLPVEALPAEVPRPLPVPAAATAAAVAVASMPVVSAADAPPAAAAPVSPPVSGGGGNEGVSADSLRQYRIDLAVAARRFRSYPALARARGWQGVSEVSLSVTAGLPVPALRLSRSSGHAVLDEQAVHMLSQAIESTPLPDGLRGRSFVVLMPIRFSLDD